MKGMTMYRKILSFLLAAVLLAGLAACGAGKPVPAEEDIDIRNPMPPMKYDIYSSDYMLYPVNRVRQNPDYIIREDAILIDETGNPVELLCAYSEFKYIYDERGREIYVMGRRALPAGSKPCPADGYTGRSAMIYWYDIYQRYGGNNYIIDTIVTTKVDRALYGRYLIYGDNGLTTDNFGEEYAAQGVYDPIQRRYLIEPNPYQNIIDISHGKFIVIPWGYFKFDLEGMRDYYFPPKIFDAQTEEWSDLPQDFYIPYNGGGDYSDPDVVAGLYRWVANDQYQGYQDLDGNWVYREQGYPMEE